MSTVPLYTSLRALNMSAVRQAPLSAEDYRALRRVDTDVTLHDGHARVPNNIVFFFCPGGNPGANG